LIPTFYQTAGRSNGPNKSKVIGENRDIKWVSRVLHYVNGRFKAYHSIVINTAQRTVTRPLY